MPKHILSCSWSNSQCSISTHLLNTDVLYSVDLTPYIKHLIALFNTTFSVVLLLYSVLLLLVLLHFDFRNSRFSEIEIHNFRLSKSL